MKRAFSSDNFLKVSWQRFSKRFWRFGYLKQNAIKLCWQYQNACTITFQHANFCISRNFAYRCKVLTTFISSNRWREALKSTWVKWDSKVCFPIIWHLDVFICRLKDLNPCVDADQMLFRTEAAPVFHPSTGLPISSNPVSSGFMWQSKCCYMFILWQRMRTGFSAIWLANITWFDWLI